MKTLQEVKASPSYTDYVNMLGDQIQSILPSRDGSDDCRCHFVLIFTDNTTCEFVSDITEDSLVKLLKETMNKIRGHGVQYKGGYTPNMPTPEEVMARVYAVLDAMGPNQFRAAAECLREHEAQILKGKV